MRLSSPPALVIFDCDGVLVDSEPISNRVFVEHLNRAGFPLTLEEAYRDLVGRSLKSCGEILEARFGRPLPDGFMAPMQAETLERLAAEVEPVDGVAAVLEVIEAAGIATCVASSGEMEKIRTTLGRTGLLPRFEGRIFSATMVARGKPFPDLFLHAAESMGKDPRAVVVVEDAAPGVQAAIAAGMTVLGYAGSPLSRPETLRAAGAAVFSAMKDLPGLLGLT